MKNHHQKSSVEKILNSTLPKEYDFIDGVEGVKLTGEGFYSSLKFKIILNNKWVEENFVEEAKDYIKDDFENDGYALLSPFSVEVYSDKLIDNNNIVNYVSKIIGFLGLAIRIEPTISYIIR